MAHDVFISYSNKDKTIADAVCSKLEDQSIRCWMAPRDVPPGANFAGAIMQAIGEAHVFVLIWSANTNTSEHILNELNQAFDQGKTVIPFRVENVEPSLSLKYYIGRTHWLDALTPPLEKHIGTLSMTILANLGRQPEISPQPQQDKVEPTGEEARPVVPPAAKPKPVIKPEFVKPVREQEIEQVKEHKIASKKGMNILPIAAGAVVLVTLVVLLLSGVFKGSPTPSSELEGSQPTALPTLSAATLIANKGTQDPQSGHWYRVISQVSTTDAWEGARSYCSMLGGHLATIESAYENDFIYKNIFLPNGSSGRLGATDRDEEGVWVWATGAQMQFTNWAAGEPDGCGGSNADVCLKADFLMFSTDNPSGQWRDVAGATGEYICEFDS